MKIKNELENKKEKAMVYTTNFTDDNQDKIKIRKETEAIPISGLDLFKWCAFVGARIQNAEEINLDKEYILEFIGMGAYIATEFKKDKYKYCVILPLRTGVVKDFLGNQVFHCVTENGKVDILDDSGSKKIYETELNNVVLVEPDKFYCKDDLTMWLK